LPPLVIPKTFKRVLRKKTARQQGAIMECVQRLGENPRHPGLHTHTIKGNPGVLEASVDRANRVTFHWDGDTIVLRMNCSHDILRRP
jgi:hypothetical protein